MCAFVPGEKRLDAQASSHVHVPLLKDVTKAEAEVTSTFRHLIIDEASKNRLFR
jgi:hypothetical protein